METMIVPIDKIKPFVNSWSARLYIPELEGLMKSIKKAGIILPLVVYENQFIIDGIKRWRICKLLGIDSVNIINYDGDPYIGRMILNFMRYHDWEDLNHICSQVNDISVLTSYGIDRGLVEPMIIGEFNPPSMIDKINLNLFDVKE